MSVMPPDRACTLELCAGIVDKDVSVEEIARGELLEEVGYDVPICKLEKIVVGRSGLLAACTNRHTSRIVMCMLCNSLCFLWLRL